MIRQNYFSTSALIYWLLSLFQINCLQVIEILVMPTTIPFRLAVCVLISSSLLFASCNEPKKDNQIPALEAKFNSLVDGGGSRESIDSTRRGLIDAYISFVDQHPQDTLAILYLDHAAELLWAEPSESREAIAVYDRIMKEYPDASLAADALFLKAFVLNNNLKAYDEAKVAYELFLKKYPDHGLASNAMQELNTMGMDLEDLYKSWEKDSLNIQEPSEE